MTNMLKPSERLRCKTKEPNYLIPAKTYEEFKSAVLARYENYNVTFTKMKARVQPFSLFRLKLTWVKI